MNGPVAIFSHTPAELDTLAMVVAGCPSLEAALPCQTEAQLVALLEERAPEMILFSAAQALQDHLSWLKTLNKRESWKEIPVVVFTDDAHVDARVAALDMGICDLLSFAVPLREINARLQCRLKQRAEVKKLKKCREDLARMALTDTLTGLCNRAFFDVTLESEAARTARTGTPYALLLVDVDHFKWVNDTYGHQLGDTVLQAIARVLRNAVRKSDMACRYGGEEFALILPETDIPKAQVLAARIHREIGELATQYSHFRQPLTVSIGISCGTDEQSAEPALVVEQADCALYAAKRKGRNRTEIFTRENAEFSRTALREIQPPSSLPM